MRVHPERLHSIDDAGIWAILASGRTVHSAKTATLSAVIPPLMCHRVHCSRIRLHEVDLVAPHAAHRVGIAVVQTVAATTALSLVLIVPHGSSVDGQIASAACAIYLGSE